MGSDNALTPWQAALVLNGLPNIGPVTLGRLMAAFGGDPARVLALGERELRTVKGVGPVIAETLLRWSSHFDLSREERLLEASGASFLPVADEAYPPLLRELPDSPIGLYRIGGYTCTARCVAIVGSRRTTPYGVGVARDLARGLAQAGYCVVSGLARGIDTAAHEAALEAGGATVAVMGCGGDICYPPENARLRDAIIEGGAILSEFPLGRRADKQSFAMRNRVVSGMSRAVIVVETDVDGGSMITAQFAAEQNRLVFAVPGRVDQPQSRGCHQLIREGATLCTGVDDVLQELECLKGLEARAASFGRREPSCRPPPSGAGAIFWPSFADGTAWVPDELAERHGAAIADVSTALLLLEMEDYVARRADGRYVAK